MFSEERAPERPFLAKSDQSSEEQHSLSPGTCLAKNRRRKEGRGKERKNRGSVSWCEGGKTQLPLCLSPVLLLKEWEGGEGASERAERLLAPSVHVFCIPALIFTQSEAGVLSVQMKGEEVPFGVRCS